MLLVNINKKLYMGNPITLSHLTLRDRKRSKSSSLRFRSLSCKREELGHILLLDKQLTRKHTQAVNLCDDI